MVEGRPFMDQFIVYSLVVFAAGFTQGFAGFGSALVALPLLALLLDVKTVIPLVNLLGLCINATLLVQLRGHLDWRPIRSLLVWAVPGIPAGALVLRFFPVRVLELAIGVLVILFPLYLLTAKPPTREAPAGWSRPFGFVSGVLGGSLGTSGPPGVIDASLQPWGKYSIKSTLVGFFLVSGAAISLTHGVTGLLTGRVLELFASGILPLLIGVLSGSLLFGKVGSDGYRRVLSAALVCLGVFMVVRSFG